jgi:hypothetical protein
LNGTPIRAALVCSDNGRPTRRATFSFAGQHLDWLSNTPYTSGCHGLLVYIMDFDGNKVPDLTTWVLS